MVGGVELVGSVRPSGRTDPLTQPETLWAQTISEWLLPGRFAFFVFRVDVPFPCEDWFPGLQMQLCETGYYVAGTLDQWDSACYALLNSGSPHDCCEIYRSIHSLLSGFGFALKGTKSTTHSRFFLL